MRLAGGEGGRRGAGPGIRRAIERRFVLRNPFGISIMSIVS